MRKQKVHQVYEVTPCFVSHSAELQTLMVDKSNKHGIVNEGRGSSLVLVFGVGASNIQVLAYFVNQKQSLHEPSSFRPLFRVICVRNIVERWETIKSRP